MSSVFIILLLGGVQVKNLFIIILLLSTGYSQNNLECWNSDQHGFISDAPEGIFIAIDGSIFRSMCGSIFGPIFRDFFLDFTFCPKFSKVSD